MLRVTIVLPVYNEEEQLASSVQKLRAFLQAYHSLQYEVVIADNGSTDGTPAVGLRLARNDPKLRVVRLEQKGRGLALKHVWSTCVSEILAYMDVDLSTDLTAFPTMISALASGDFDLATGSRLLPGSATTRCWKREVISRCYNLLVRAVFGTCFSDAQCGFKAITRSAADRLLPSVMDTGWFFDTELLVLAEKCGYRILDLPVRWIEDPDSRVRIISTVLADLKGIARLRRSLRNGTYGHSTKRRFGGDDALCEARSSVTQSR